MCVSNVFVWLGKLNPSKSLDVAENVHYPHTCRMFHEDLKGVFHLQQRGNRSSPVWRAFQFDLERRGRDSQEIVRRFGASAFSRQLLPHNKADNNVNFAGKQGQTTDITYRKGVVLFICIRIWVRRTLAQTFSPLYPFPDECAISNRISPNPSCMVWDEGYTLL